MSAQRGEWRRWPVCGALALIALLLSGCVYLRLLEVKKQFEKFDQNFALQTTEGIKIVCQKPVLLDDDIRWLGMRPETIAKSGRAELWRLRWAKELPPGVTDKGNFFLSLQLMFAEGKLTGVTIPESYFALLPKSFVLGVIKSFGGGQVDKSSRQVEAAVGHDIMDVAQPKLPAIDKVLGLPTEEKVEGEYTVQRYRYRTVSAEKGGGIFEMTLRFRTSTGQLVHWRGKMPVGDIAFKFE